MNKSAARLAGPLAISLALHLGAGWLLSPGVVEYRPRTAKSVTLTVTLASKTPADPLPVVSAEPPSVAPATLASTAAADAAGKLTQKARFIIPPDLTPLEEIPVPISGSLTLRLHVSSLGTVEGITVVKSDPVPKDLLDGLLKRFEQTRLSPALAGSEPVASTLDLVIHYEVGLTFLPRNP